VTKNPSSSSSFTSTPHRTSEGADGNDDGDDEDEEGFIGTGQEHTGRWTKEEHELFLRALERYGKEWKKVAAMVKTRTVVQTRTHAQKYFQKKLKSGKLSSSQALFTGHLLI
jgi:SHAQKYF class myb-like DNA-binding protein